MFNWSKLKNQDLLITFLSAILTILGLVTVFTTTYFSDYGISEDFKQQVLFVAVGIAAFVVLTALNSQLIKEPRLQAFLIIVAIITLLYLLFGGEVISGTRRWIALGSFRFQPSEFAKLVIITSTSAIFASTREVSILRPKNILSKLKSSKSLPWKELSKLAINTLSVLTMVFLIMQQPSLGNSILALSLWFLMIGSMLKYNFGMIVFPIVVVLGFLSSTADLGVLNSLWGIDLLMFGLSIIFILIANRLIKIDLIMLLIVFAAGLFVGSGSDAVWNNVLNEYQRDRVVSFLNPEADPLGSQWQVTQSKIAIGSGQFFGRGLLQGSQSNSGILPFAYTDFAYAAFVEQFGLVGSFVLLGTYYLLITRMLVVANRQKDNFDRLIIVGVATMLALNVIVNVGMNIGIMPVTGVPLPFISYGGSAILVSFLGIGLVQMVVSSRSSDKAEVEKFGRVNVE